VNNAVALWDEVNDCNNNKIDMKKLEISTYVVLNKLHDIINGEGHQCFKTIHKYSYYEDIFWQRFETVIVTNVKLSKHQCKAMVLAQECGGNQMTCDSNGCWYAPTAVPDYKYLRNVDVVVENCRFTTKLILAKDKNEKLFENCYVQDYFCNLHDSIIIWDKSVVHECPFEKVMIEEFNSSNQMIWNPNKHYLFQKTRQEQNCMIQMTLTQEGLYVVDLKTLNDQQKAVLNQLTKNIDPKAFTDLQLSDYDYTEFLNNRALNKLQLKTCELFYSSLQIFKQQEESFLRIKDANSNSLIIYSRDNKIIIPTCIDVSEIEVIEKTEYCYNDIGVKFVLNEKNTTGFLTKDNILVSHSKHVACSNQVRKFVVNTTTIILVQNKSIVLTRNNLNYVSLHFNMKNFDDLNFKHSDQIKNGLNVIDDIVKYTQFNDDSNIMTATNNNAIKMDVQDIN